MIVQRNDIRLIGTEKGVNFLTARTATCQSFQLYAAAGGWACNIEMFFFSTGRGSFYWIVAIQRCNANYIFFSQHTEPLGVDERGLNRATAEQQVVHLFNRKFCELHFRRVRHPVSLEIKGSTLSR